MQCDTYFYQQSDYYFYISIILSLKVDGEYFEEDRCVILPLELCHQIHKYWAKTLDGKFNHESQVLDQIIREDEILDKRLQVGVFIFTTQKQPDIL